MEAPEGLGAALRALLREYPKIHDWTPVFGFGSIVSLFRSLYDTARRSGSVLFADAFFSGVAAVIAWDVSNGSLAWTGGSAVAAGGLVMGIYKAGRQFADRPIDVAERVWQKVGPVVLTRPTETTQSDAAPPATTDDPPEMRG